MQVGPITVVVDDRHHDHDPAYELNAGRRVEPRRERPARATAIEAALTAAGHPRVDARPHGLAPIEAVHDPDMIAFLRDGHDAWRLAGGPEVMIPDTFRSPRWAGGGRRGTSPVGAAGWWVFDTATPIVAGSYLAARAAADVALTAVDELAAGAHAVYGLTRPPGHHAGPDYLGGFCLINHAAIAARALTAGGRVAVVDVDVHHGNGTQDVFAADPAVLYTSVHGHPDHLFPFFSGFPDERGRDAGVGFTRNLPLDEGADDAAFLAAIDLVCAEVERFDPTTVVVSLGFDAAATDPIGSLAVSRDGFVRLGDRLAALDRPTVLVQEGGYDLDHLGELATATLAACGGAS